MEHPNRLKEWRERANFSQDELADAISSGRSTIVKLERGERELTIEMIERLAPALKCDPWELLPEKKSSEQQEIELRLRFRAMGRGQRGSLLSVAQQIIPKRD